VHGAIRDEWSSLGWERSFLGYPVTDETVAPDGVGHYNHFQNGSIYWSPSTGAHEVQGLIRDKWASLGWEQSYLGYPTSDEHDCVNGARCSNFQNGYIVWSASTGAIDTSFKYYVELDSFEVDHTRARHEDTDFVVLTAEQEPTGQQDDAPTWQPLNVNNGTYAPLNGGPLVLGPYLDLPDDTNELVFNYGIVNKGHHNGEDFLNAMIQAGLSAGGAAVGTAGEGSTQTGAAALGGGFAGLLGTAVNMFFANCDGVVAADQFGPYTGGTLWAMTASGSHSETHSYPGTDSPNGCGKNSIYKVTWHIARDHP